MPGLELTILDYESPPFTTWPGPPLRRQLKQHLNKWLLSPSNLPSFLSYTSGDNVYHKQHHLPTYLRTYLLTYPPRYTHWWSSSSVCRDWTFLFRSVKCLTQKMKLCPFVRSFKGGDNKRFPAAIKKLFPTSDRHSELIEIRDHFSWREWYWRPPLSINSRIGAYR